MLDSVVVVVYTFDDELVLELEDLRGALTHEHGEDEEDGTDGCPGGHRGRVKFGWIAFAGRLDHHGESETRA